MLRKPERSEFRDFISAPEKQPPVELSAKVLKDAGAYLNPPLPEVFSKLGVIHAVVGALTLLVCPQFGISPRGAEFVGMMALFMKFGHVGCMLGCGAFFLGTSELVASLCLRPEEVLVMRRNRWLQAAGLTCASAAVLVALGGSLELWLAAAWLAGSLLGGMVALELGWGMRLALIRSA